MKILFWLLAIVSMIVGFFTSVVCLFANSLGLSGTVLGDIVCIVGSFSLIVSIVLLILGIIRLRKGDTKKAVILVLVGVLYSVLMIGGYVLDDAIHTVQHNNSIDAYYNDLYGEGWDSPSRMEGIPELYEDVLNEFYAVIKGNHTETLMNLGATAMPVYYGDAPLENIGFLLMDLNNDGIEEFLIGTTAPVEEGGTAVICVYSDPENPSAFPGSVEDEWHYLYQLSDGSYVVEKSNSDTFWKLIPAAEPGILDFCDYEGEPLTPEDRLVFDLIPFSQYK